MNQVSMTLARNNADYRQHKQPEAPKIQEIPEVEVSELETVEPNIVKAKVLSKLNISLGTEGQTTYTHIRNRREALKISISHEAREMMAEIVKNNG